MQIQDRADLWMEFSRLWHHYRKGDNLTRAEARQHAMWQIRCTLRDNDPRDAAAWDDSCKDQLAREGAWTDEGARS